MKLLLVLLIASAAFSQQQPPPHPIEFYLYQNISGTQTIKYMMNARSAVWNETGYSIKVDPEYPTLNSLIISSQSLTGSDGGYGWNFVTSSDIGFPVIGYGLYKLTALNTGAYFYLDARDRNYQFSGISADCSIKYSSTPNRFYAIAGINPSNYGSAITNGTTKKINEIFSVNTTPSTSIFNGYSSNNSLFIKDTNSHPFLHWQNIAGNTSTVKYRVVRAFTIYNSTLMPPYDNLYCDWISEIDNTTYSFIDSSIVETPDDEDGYLIHYFIEAYNSQNTKIAVSDTVVLFGNTDWANNGLIMTTDNQHPRLVWVTDKTQNVDSLKVYRKYGSNSFVNIASVGDTTIFIDNSIITNNLVSGAKAYYYVKAIQQSQNFNSNTVNVNTSTQSLEKKQNNFKNGVDYSFCLNQNFPNPFNPETVIKYSLAADSKASIKVYDLLGSEVADLVNETQSTGEHSVKFNGSSLSSGVYLVRMNAGSFSDSRKIVLMK